MWLALAVVAVVGLVTVVLGWMGLNGSLPRNHFAGIRTRFTQSSDAAWKATHRAGGPYLIFGGVAAAMVALAFLPFAAAGKVSTGIASVAVIVAATVLVVAAVAGWQIGVRTARRELAMAQTDNNL
ncbi:MAG: SdpI family protein [Tepidiformaceae bacterium]